MSKKKTTMALVAFITIIAAAIAYLVQVILGFSNISNVVIGYIQSVVTAVLFIIVSITAWQYCKNRAIVYKILYFVVIAIVAVGIVLPLVL